jgi:hypothetical protein
MLDLPQLRELQRSLRNRKVLSVFVDTSTTDPTRGSTWRDELNRALARLDATPPCSSSGEHTARELCTAHLRTALEGMRGALGAPGWVAYVTTDDVVAAEPVRARLKTGVFWQNGMVIGPILAALARPRGVGLADVGAEEVVSPAGESVSAAVARLPYPLVRSPNPSVSRVTTP